MLSHTLSLEQINDPSNEGRISPELIKSALDQFISEHQLDIEATARTSLYAEAVKAFQDKVDFGTSLTQKILALQESPLQQAVATYKALYDHILNKVIPNGRLSSTDLTFLVRRLLNFVRLASFLSPTETSFSHFSDIGLSLTGNGFNWDSPNYGFVKLAVFKILKTARRLTTIPSLRAGKELLVSFFTSLTAYDAPDSHYTAFITRKYNKFGLKWDVINNSEEYSRMLRIFAIDVLRTSLTLKTELLKSADIHKLFDDFPKMLQGYNPKEQALFINLRRMLVNAGPIMDKFPLLFESLYDAILHATQYFSSGVQNFWTNPSDAPQLFDSYLDSMWQWKQKLISWIWGWEPNPKDFPINIEENYAFFKLINLVTFTPSFRNSDVSFVNFSYQNNYWIHKYTSEAVPRRFLNFLRHRHFPDGSFNYKHLAGKKFDKKVMGKYADYVTPE